MNEKKNEIVTENVTETVEQVAPARKNLRKMIDFAVEHATFKSPETGDLIPYDKVHMTIKGVKMTVKASSAADSGLLTYFLNELKAHPDHEVSLHVVEDSFINEGTGEVIPFKRVILTVNGQEFAIKASKKDKNLLLYFVNELTK